MDLASRACFIGSRRSLMICITTERQINLPVIFSSNAMMRPFPERYK